MKNASINSEVTVILKECNKLLGTVCKRGNNQIFIPPDVEKEPEYKIDVPSEVRYKLSKNKQELENTELEGFDEMITQLRKYWDDKQRISHQDEPSNESQKQENKQATNQAIKVIRNKQ